MTKKRHFSQEEKHTILMSAKEIGVEKAAEIAGIHYTTVYGWRSDLEAMGVDAFLAYKPSRPGRGVKHITEKQEKEILDVWEKNPGLWPRSGSQSTSSSGNNHFNRNCQKNT